MPFLLWKENMCRTTGFVNVYSEMAALLYVVHFSYLLKKKVQNPTGNVSKVILNMHLFSLLVPAVFCITESFTLMFGVSVRVYVL